MPDYQRIRQNPAKESGKDMLVVFTGDGKGKTTASLGQAVRMVGRGKKVLMIQFIKGPWKSGEDFVDLRRRGNEKTGFELRKRGLGFVGILGDKLPRADHVAAAESALKEFEAEVKANMWDAFILDEVNVAISLGLLLPDRVLRALENVPNERIVILTGRNAHPAFIDRADLVTEMKDVKHPFYKGENGKIGVEF